MARKIWAFLAFNLYSLFLLSAFQENTAYLFDTELIRIMSLTEMDISPLDWGWGPHYIWRLFAALVVTALAGILTGAIAKTSGGKTAVVANVPSILAWLTMVFLLGFARVEVEGRLGFLVVSIIAIPLTSYVAYVFGCKGEELQSSSFEDATVLGIRGYHWAWAVLPIYSYAIGIVDVVTRFAGYQLAAWWGHAPHMMTWGQALVIFLHILVSLLMLVPVVAWICPLWIAYCVLRGEWLSSRHAVIRGLCIFLVLVLGWVFALGIELGAYLALGTLARIVG